MMRQYVLRKMIIWSLLPAWFLVACQSADQTPTTTPSDPEQLPGYPAVAPAEAEQPSGYPAATPEPAQAMPAYPGNDAPGGEVPEAIEVFPTHSIRVVPPPTIGEIPTEILETLHADARDRAGQPGSAITALRAEAVEWPDGSLGCPQPGMMYTQAIVPGYWVVLELAGKQFDYRVSERGHFVLCENGAPPISLPSS